MFHNKSNLMSDLLGRNQTYLLDPCRQVLNKELPQVMQSLKFFGLKRQEKLNQQLSTLSSPKRKTNIFNVEVLGSKNLLQLSQKF